MALAVARKHQARVREVFDRQVWIGDASDSNLGRATIGNRKDWIAFEVRVGSSAAAVMGKGRVNRSRQSDQKQFVINGICALLADEANSRVSFLIHWMTGDWKTEKVADLREIKVTCHELMDVEFDIQEDVLYQVLKDIYDQP